MREQGPQALRPKLAEISSCAGQFRCFLAGEPEVIAPSHYQRVEFPYLFGRCLLQGIPASPLTDPFHDPLHLLLARSGSDVDFPGLGRIAPPKNGSGMVSK